MHRVAEGIEDGGNLQRDRLRMLPHTHHGYHDVFGKSPRQVHAHALSVSAEVAAPGKAVAAASADDVALAADNIPGIVVSHVRAHLDDLSHKLVADDQGNRDSGAGPLIPLIDVQVGATNAGMQHTNLDVIDANLGLGNILQPQPAGIAAFHESFHLRAFISDFAGAYFIFHGDDTCPAQDAGVNAMVRSQQRDFGAAGIDTARRQAVADFSEERAQHRDHAAADDHNIGFQQVYDFAQPQRQEFDCLLHSFFCDGIAGSVGFFHNLAAHRFDV